MNFSLAAHVKFSRQLITVSPYLGLFKLATNQNHKLYVTPTQYILKTQCPQLHPYSIKKLMFIV